MLLLHHSNNMHASVHRSGPKFLMHKNEMQEYAQSAHVDQMHPVYEVVQEGSPHLPRFKCTVTLNGVSYASASGYSTLKSAEHAAAKVALEALRPASSRPARDSGLCKTLLQSYAQINRLPLPVYQTSTGSPVDYGPTFTSSVEIAGVKYSGVWAYTKKAAEVNAAKTALLAIQSDLASTVEPEFPKPQLGLSAFIDSQIDNMYTVRKRGREPEAPAEDLENTVRKLKMDDIPTVETSSEAITGLATPAEAAAEESMPVADSTTERRKG